MRYKLSIALALTLSANALFAANSTDLNKTNDAATTQNSASSNDQNLADTSLAEVQVVGDLSKTEGTGSYTADRMNTATGLGLKHKGDTTISLCHLKSANERSKFKRCKFSLAICPWNCC